MTIAEDAMIATAEIVMGVDVMTATVETEMDVDVMILTVDEAAVEMKL